MNHVDLSTVVLKNGAHQEKTPGEWCFLELLDRLVAVGSEVSV